MVVFGGHVNILRALFTQDKILNSVILLASVAFVASIAVNTHRKRTPPIEITVPTQVYEQTSPRKEFSKISPLKLVGTQTSTPPLPTETQQKPGPLGDVSAPGKDESPITVKSARTSAPQNELSLSSATDTLTHMTRGLGNIAKGLL